MKTRGMILLAAMLVFGSAIHAHATLIDRGSGMIYDNDLDITWYDFAYASTSWEDAAGWAADLALTIGGTVYDDWRLPSAGPDPQLGENQISTDMGHLYYTELGNVAFGGLLNVGPFASLTANPYWTGTPYSDYSSWVFGFATGRQLIYQNTWELPAMAVRSGDVGASPVPEPTSVLLLSAGMMGLAALRHKRR